MLIYLRVYYYHNNKMPGNDSNEKLVTVSGNKIRFWADVTEDSCKELIEHIIKLEEKYDSICNNYSVKTKNVPIIELYINSSGGTVHDALAVVDHIQASKYKFISIVQGHAASAATIISVVCDTRKIYKNGMMLIHEMSAGTRGRMTFMNDDIESYKKLTDILVDIYKKNTKITASDIKKMLKREIYCTSNEALMLGLVDEIIESKKETKFYKKDKKRLTFDSLKTCKLKVINKFKKVKEETK